MREIFVKHNPHGYKIFIEGNIDISQLPKAELDLLASELEPYIQQCVSKKQKRKCSKSSQ